MTGDIKIKIVRDRIDMGELKKMAKDGFGNLVKAVVDIKRGIMAIGGELHSDEEASLLEDGSRQVDLWGINLYPELQLTEWIEFDSIINIRPSQGNFSREVESVHVRDRIKDIVNKLVRR